MNTYYMTFKVVPTIANEHYNTFKSALVHCWVLDNSSESAFSKAYFYVSKYDWKVEKVENLPIETTEDHFLGQDIYIQHYKKAQENGFAVVFFIHSKNGKISTGPITLKSSFNITLSNYLKKIKQFQNDGRCLHYAAGERCNKIINAHSIQRKKALSAIACNGHVYRLTSDISSLRKNKGNLSFQKRGIKNVSTFLGFCEKHDNELFEPIDKHPLVPTEQQIFLYSYRSLCRELFVKENSLNIIESQLNEGPTQKAINDFFLDLRKGTNFGLKNLKMHKLKYDDSLKKKHYHNIKYVLFTSTQKPFIIFSGLFYPDFDFMGRLLQNLGNHESDLKLITFCSAPMNEGWGFLFAWHETSSKVCDAFMQSIATMIHENRKIEDLLFRLVISNCENHAISPQWWEKLSTKFKEQILERASKMYNMFTNTPQSYLMEGLEGIASWKFESVIQT